LDSEALGIAVRGLRAENIEGGAVEEFHHSKRVALVFSDVVQSANVRMIQGRRRAGLATEALQNKSIAGNVIGQ
jgi:hypothetical protein